MYFKILYKTNETKSDSLENINKRDKDPKRKAKKH